MSSTSENATLSAVSKPPTPAGINWIVNQRFDLGWFFGGALISLLVLGLHVSSLVSIVGLWWIFVIVFDGPHIAATFTRTYFDREEWRTRPGVLMWTLLAFLVGPAFLALTVVTGSADPFSIFLGLTAFYAFHHVVRQHYGFVALYKSVNREWTRLDFHLDKWVLYVGCWAPFLYVLISHPRARIIVGIPDGPMSSAEQILVGTLAGVWGLSLLVFLGRCLMLWRTTGLNWPKVAYVLLTVLLSGFIYLIIARFEPVYALSRGPDEDFLLIAIMFTIWHDVQYIGLVWFHNRNRYGTAGKTFGPATVLNRSLARFFVVCGVLSLFNLLFISWTGKYPGVSLFDFRIGSVTAGEIGLCLYWGLAVHHYLLDQNVWRVKGDAALKRNLGLA